MPKNSYYIEDKSDKDEEGGLIDFSQFDRGVIMFISVRLWRFKAENFSRT